MLAHLKTPCTCTLYIIEHCAYFQTIHTCTLCILRSSGWSSKWSAQPSWWAQLQLILTTITRCGVCQPTFVPCWTCFNLLINAVPFSSGLQCWVLNVWFRTTQESTPHPKIFDVEGWWWGGWQLGKGGKVVEEKMQWSLYLKYLNFMMRQLGREGKWKEKMQWSPYSGEAWLPTSEGSLIGIVTIPLLLWSCLKLKTFVKFVLN